MLQLHWRGTAYLCLRLPRVNHEGARERDFFGRLMRMPLCRAGWPGSGLARDLNAGLVKRPALHTLHA